ncbi:MAG: CoA pyrophosphatase [Chloroflexi bacterium]|nr:MAG: CoA pyrophosphatase [Chloroflexota bacterium]
MSTRFQNVGEITEEALTRCLVEVSPQSKPPESARPFPIPEELRKEMGEPKPAGVLVPFLKLDGDWHILFTRRTDTLVEHKGQVAFPGGRMDADDPSPEFTALREAFEEIGLQPESVRVLGRLDSFITNTNYLLTPIVGLIGWPFPLKIAQEEVQRVFTIPLRWLADPENREVRQRELPAPYPPVPVIYFKPYDGEVLWGVSAYITVNLIDLLFGGKKGN